MEVRISPPSNCNGFTHARFSSTSTKLVKGGLKIYTVGAGVCNEKAKPQIDADRRDLAGPSSSFPLHEVHRKRKTPRA